MKKILLGLALGILFFSFSASKIFGEEVSVFNFGKAYEDYLYNLNLYRDSYHEFATAKDQYASYKTLTAKTLLLEQTINMLQKRDEALKTYLTALRLNLAETTGILNYEQNLLYLELDNQIIWLNNHKETVPSVASLEDALSSARLVENKYPEIEVLAYKTLTLSTAGQRIEILNQTLSQIGALREKLKTETLSRWLLEAENKAILAEEKLNQAKALTNSLKSNSRDKKDKFLESSKLIKEAHQYLKEANSYLLEAIIEIKKKN